MVTNRNILQCTLAVYVVTRRSLSLGSFLSFHNEYWQEGTARNNGNIFGQGKTHLFKYIRNLSSRFPVISLCSPVFAILPQFVRIGQATREFETGSELLALVGKGRGAIPPRKKRHGI